MTVFYDQNKQRWVAQVGGFEERPKKRTVFADTEHDAQIAEHWLRAKRDKAAMERQRNAYHAIDKYLTSENQFTLVYWIAYTVKNHWTNPRCKQPSTVMLIANRMGPNTDIRLIDKNWLSDYANLCRSKFNNTDQTIKCALEALGVVLKQAKEEGAISKIPKKPTLQSTQKCKFVPRPEWIDELKIEISKHSYSKESKKKALPILVDFLRFTGCRVSEALQLDWADIQLSNLDLRGEPDPVIWFKHAPEENKFIKNKQTYRIEVWSELEVLLLELKKLNPLKPFPYDYPFFRRHFSAARDSVVEKLELDESVKSLWKIHRLRALSCTEKASYGWNCWEIMHWHNHSDVTISQGYVTDSEEQAQKRRRLMESQTRN